MQQNISLQHNNQTNIAQQQIKSQTVQQPQRQILNSHIISQNVSSITNTNLQAQLQNIQLNGNLAHIQVPNGLNSQFIGQIPAQFQPNLAGLSQISTNINDLQYNNMEMQSTKTANNLSNLITVPTVMHQNVVVSTASISKVGPMMDTEAMKLNEAEKSTKDTVDSKTSSKGKKTKKVKKAKGKLDLANLMKLSGIIEDDEMNFLDAGVSSTSTSAPNEQQVIVQVASQSSTSAQDSDPSLTLKGPDEVPMIITMPTNQTEDNLNGNNQISNLSAQAQSSVKANKFPCMIMIQNSDNTEPYKISLSNLTTNVTDTTKDCETSNDDMSANLSKLNESSTMNLCVSNFANSTLSSVSTPTIQSQINEIQNHLMGFNQAVSIASTNGAKGKVSKVVNSKSPEILDIRNNEIEGLNVHANIPSQIGNIQISQVNIPVSVKNSENVLNRNVDNQIQIMPIVDNSNINSSVNKLVNSYLTRQIPTQNAFPRSDSLIGLSASDGFVGGLSLSLSEDGRIVLRQDNRASVPDLQSQVLLRNLISSSAGVSNTNLTISQPQPVFLSTISNMNSEEIKQKPITNCVNSVSCIATPKANLQQPLTESHQQVLTSQAPNMLNQRQYFQDNDLNKTKVNPVQQPLITSEFSENITKTVAAPVTKLIELPKIGSNQQLFSLNTATDQITKLNPKLTTLALTPTEQLLIVPAGINAEQLAQCLLQGQIHFNDITGIVSSNNSPVNSTQNLGTSDDSTNKEIHVSKTDQYKNNKTNSKSSLSVPNTNLNNKHIQLGSADTMISQKVVNNCNHVPPLVNVSAQNVGKSCEAPKPNPNSCMPRLIPILSDNMTQNPSNFVPRIQTIQLTPQKQQLLKTVQLQIQALSAKLQNKNSLANLCIPVLDTVSNTATAVIQPNLSLSDCEIHLELQNLFIEQQKILATGKVIPTIPGQHANFQIPDSINKSGQVVPTLPLLQTESNNSNVIKKEIINKGCEIKTTKFQETSITIPSTSTVTIQSKPIQNQISMTDNLKNNVNKINSTPYSMQVIFSIYFYNIK